MPFLSAFPIRSRSRLGAVLTQGTGLTIGKTSNPLGAFRIVWLKVPSRGRSDPRNRLTNGKDIQPSRQPMLVCCLQPFAV